MVRDILIGLIVAGTLALAGWLFRGWVRGAVVATVSALRRRIQAMRRTRTARAHVSRCEREIREAAEAGENIVVSVTGRNPATIRWEGARPEKTHRYENLPPYKRDMLSRRVPHLRATCCGRPPKIGTRRKVSIPTKAT